MDSKPIALYPSKFKVKKKNSRPEQSDNLNPCGLNQSELILFYPYNKIIIFVDVKRNHCPTATNINQYTYPAERSQIHSFMFLRYGILIRGEKLA